ncbi:hypothetical protein Tco_0941875 [Tanacetum coccineum]|uniref:Reverse transcriptase domain-containing protein n=1 Tax=Tanacetum coccineum TaxID=301880 RepID=A0ABQ5DSK5_9ASTR
MGKPFKSSKDWIGSAVSRRNEVTCDLEFDTQCDVLKGKLGHLDVKSLFGHSKFLKYGCEAKSSAKVYGPFQAMVKWSYWKLLKIISVFYVSKLRKWKGEVLGLDRDNPKTSDKYQNSNNFNSEQKQDRKHRSDSGSKTSLFLLFSKSDDTKDTMRCPPPLICFVIINSKYNSQQKWRHDEFTLLTKSPKEILALDKGKFKTPPPMTTLVEKINNNKFCVFHEEVGHNTDECMHMRRQIEELIKAGKLSHVIKELKQGSRKDQPKAAKKGETSKKDKPLAILTVQPWQRVARQRITQSFCPNPKSLFPPLGDEDGTEGPMIIEAEIGCHFIHRIYVDGGSTSEIIYEHCFNGLRPEVKIPMVPATAPLIGFSGHMANGTNIAASKNRGCRAFNLYMDEFYGGDITISVQWDHRKARVRKIQAVPSTAHGMLKFLVPGGILTLRSNRIIPLECTMVFRPEAQPSSITQAVKERIRVAIHPEYPEQTIAIGSTLTEEGRKALCGLLRRNLDIFAWKPEDMTGVPRHLAERRLNVREGCLPVKQKKRSQAPERNKAIQEEVAKLVNAEIIKEVHYHSWLSNPVIVKKHDDS